MMEDTMNSAVGTEKKRRYEERGSILWIPFHVLRWIFSICWENKKVSFVCGLIGAPLLWIAKPYFQPLFLKVRILAPEILGAVIIFALIYILLRRKKYIGAIVTFLIFIGIGLMVLTTGSRPHYYHTLFFQFNTLDKASLKELPETRFERIHPLNSIHTATNTRIAETLHTTIPDYVSWGKGVDPHWTVGIEPAYPHQRFFGEVNRIFSLPGQNHLLDFSGENQVSVKFDSGEKMHLYKNASYLARQSFGIWRFLSYAPNEMKYIPGPDGEIVQCITLTKWDGFIFPRPHFGGVVIIKQGETTFLGKLKRLFFGEGEWVRPEDIKDFDWLAGQNLVPYEVSRHVANSFRFRYGYFAPFPLTHYRDLRVPNLPGDVNDQPFTTFFQFYEEKSSKLYHYFALEPYQNDDRAKSGLAISIFFPADGIGKVYYYEHAERNENLAGVSSVSTYIKENQKTIDWERNEVAEHRPYIHPINGKKRLCWLSTVVTKTDTGNGFIAGSSIDVFITDAATTQPVKVDAGKPWLWVSQIEEAMKSKPDAVADSN